MAGRTSTFTIEAKNDMGFPNYRGRDVYSMAVINGPASISDYTVSYVRVNFYEVEYTPLMAGTYNVQLYLNGKEGLTNPDLPLNATILPNGQIDNYDPENTNPPFLFCYDQLMTNPVTTSGGVIVSPAPASASTSTMTFSSPQFSAGPAGALTVRMSFRDAFNNEREIDVESDAMVWVENLAEGSCEEQVRSEYQPCSVLPQTGDSGCVCNGILAATASTSLGEYEVTIIREKAGMYRFSGVIFNDDFDEGLDTNVQGSPTEYELQPGGMDGGRTLMLGLISEADISANPDGKEIYSNDDVGTPSASVSLGVVPMQTLMFQAVDSYMNPVTQNFSVALAFEAQGEAEPMTIVTDSSSSPLPGQFEVSFEPNSVAIYDLTATVTPTQTSVGGAQGQSFDMGPFTLEYRPGTAEPESSSVTGSGLLGATAGEIAVYTIVLRDQFGPTEPCVLRTLGHDGKLDCAGGWSRIT